jgi:hypothetical protein
MTEGELTSEIPTTHIGTVKDAETLSDDPQSEPTTTNIDSSDETSATMNLLDMTNESVDGITSEDNTNFEDSPEQTPEEMEESPKVNIASEEYTTLVALPLELKSSLQEQTTLRIESDHRANIAEQRAKDYDTAVADKHTLEQELDQMKGHLSILMQDKKSLELELIKLRGTRDDHERKEILLSNRVNDAKKKEALKTNLAEQLQTEVKSLQEQLTLTETQLSDERQAKEKAELTHTNIMTIATDKLQRAENALSDERRLNEERKKKMKVFVESKQEEIRQARAQADELNLELSQTNRSMREHNARWKQLHAQWVQSQTRNRELQRELSKLQKDQETAHRMGDKMELQMAKSAQETSLHKTKRLTAKHELMTILRTLDVERELSSKLRDCIKFTFTPKALSQQQLMKESLKDLERELLQLSRRLGRPLPPSLENPDLFTLEETAEDENHGKKSRNEIDTDHLLSNLEDETQRVSQCIIALGSSIERMHMVLSDSGERNCVGVLHDILTAASGTQLYGQVMTNENS